MKRSLMVVLFAPALLAAQSAVPEISYTSTPNLLKLPEHLYLGEAAGVATNSKGDIFVYTRTGTAFASMGGSRVFTHGGARLFEFTPNGTYVREIGQGLYGFLFAHAVRIDPRDNIWVVDEGSSMIMKFNPEGRVLMTLGRKPESINVGAPEGGRGGGGRGGRGLPGAGAPGDSFNRPTDVAWDAAGNIFVADGYGNSRVAKFDKNGKYLKSWGSKGTEPGQFDTLHAIAVDAQGNVYVGDRGNKRIQVFDNDGTFKTQYTDVGAPYAMCITTGAHQYLFTSNSNPSTSMDNGEIYKMELDGKVLGKFGHAGKLLKEFGTVHEMDCRNPNELYVGELTNWRVQKLILHAN
ncbi:MAG: peptidyl-alpha-hydroxyglycine alpha-amidating lyase family protein [Acidobacteriia bacterium]|nr:peptidyl-alpha-hydroxyglycine alpha-amidating lyase family protein [Terriglobia bacterium]